MRGHSPLNVLRPVAGLMAVLTITAALAFGLGAAPGSSQTIVPETIYTPTTVPAGAVAIGSSYPVVTAQRIAFSCTGRFSSVRWYRNVNDTGTITLGIWRGSTLLTTVSAPAPTAVGWVSFALSAPVPVTPGDELLIGLHHPNGAYAVTVNGLNGRSSVSPSGCMTAPASAPAAGNGLYAYSPTLVRPTLSYAASEYFLSPEFELTQSSPTTTTPTTATPTTATPTTATPTTASPATTSPATTTTPATTAPTSTAPTTTAPTTTTPTTTVAPGSPPSRPLYGANESPGTQYALGSVYPIQTAQRFIFDCVGRIDGVWWYRTAAETGTTTVNAWNSAQLLATGTSSGATSTGWIYVPFGASVQVGSGTELVLGIHRPNGAYPVTLDGFASVGRASTCVRSPASTSSAPNGLYTYRSTPGLPTSSYRSSDYWIAPRFVAGASPTTTSSTLATSTTTPTTLSPTTLTPTTVSPGTTLPATTAPTTIAPTTTTTSTSTTVPATTVPATTGPGTAHVPYSAAATPTGSVAIGSNYPVSLGHRTRVECAGSITGVWWYRTAADTGTITVSAWRNGTAVAAGAGDPAAGPGWRFVAFTGALPVTAGEELIVSVHHPNGSYGVTNNGMTAAKVSPSSCIRFPASTTSAGNGMYTYGPPQLPKLTYLASDYLIAPAFEPTPPATTSTTTAAPTTTAATTTILPATSTTTSPTTTSPTTASPTTTTTTTTTTTSPTTTTTTTTSPTTTTTTTTTTSPTTTTAPPTTTTAPPAPSVALHHTFDTTTHGWQQWWNPSALSVTADSHTGPGALRIAASSGPATAFHQTSLLVGGHRYRAQMWARTDAVSMYVLQFDASWNFLGTITVPWTAALPTQWVAIDETFAITSETAHINFAIASGGSTMLIDDLRLSDLGPAVANIGTIRTPIPTTPWTLQWSDEFNGTSLDASKWTPDSATNDSNGELQCYTPRPENVSVANGSLVLRAQRETAITCPGETRFPGGRQYSSGFVRSTLGLQEGKVEIRAKLPVGQGIWPALWLWPRDTNRYPGGRNGEIDIVEVVGHQPSTVYGSLHYDYSKRIDGRGMRSAATTLAQPVDQNFHVYAVEWERERIRWMVDGTVYFEMGAYTTPWYPPVDGPWPAPFDQEFIVLMNVAVGGSWPGSPDATTPFPADMAVDWVRVYKHAS